MLKLQLYYYRSPLITDSHSLLAQGLPSLLYAGALHASILTVLPHQEPSLPHEAWHLIKF